MPSLMEPWWARPTVVRPRPPPWLNTSVPASSPSRNVSLTDPELETLEEQLADQGQSLPVTARRMNYTPIERVDWQEAQKSDNTLRKAANWVLGGRSGPLATALGDDSKTPEGQAYVRQRDNFVHSNGYLYVSSNIKGHPEPGMLFVVPHRYRQQAIDGCHRDAGHQGQDRTLSLLRDRFWWPGMAKHARKSIRGCQRCIKYEGRSIKAPLVPIYATAPMELLHTDFTSIERPVALNKQPKPIPILVFTDHFTRYAFAYKTSDYTARTIAEVLYNQVIALFGAPARLLSDQGTGFMSEVVRELCNLLGVEKCRTSAYHAQTNGQVERMHQTIMRMIGKLSDNKKLHWEHHLPEILQAYNATRSELTGYSPFYLMFGRRPRLPLDFVFPTVRGDLKPRRVPEYVATLLEHLRLAFDEARKTQEWEAGRQKKHYDRHTGSAVLKPGDVVLMKTDAFVGKRKIKDRWGDAPYVVEAQLAGGLPVYKLKDASGREKTAHRNRLLFVCSTKKQGNGADVAPLPPAGQVLVRMASTVVTNPKATHPRKDEVGEPHEKNGMVLAPGLPRNVPWAWIHGQIRPIPWVTGEAPATAMEPVSPDPAPHPSEAEESTVSVSRMAEGDVD